ncbi:MAG: ATP-binding protein [Novosphingobium sp.]
MTGGSASRSGFWGNVVRWLRAYPGSLAGRLTLILVIGMPAASLLALHASQVWKTHAFADRQHEAALQSVADIAKRYEAAPEQTHKWLSSGFIFGAHKAEAVVMRKGWDAALSRSISQRLGHAAKARRLPRRECFSNLVHYPPAAGMNTDPLPDCWLVQYFTAAGAERRFVIDLLPDPDRGQPPVGPPYLELIIVAGALLGLLTARIATAPLRRMEKAARQFSLAGDLEPIPVKGPSEVRAALETFNLAQSRVREGLRERTQILASVTHDLQTPLTRLRLRLEQVEDEVLRARLVADLAVTQQMVRDGLDLARSSEVREPWAVIDVDSVLSALAEDYAEVGRDVKFVEQRPVEARVKPNALGRALANLVDNALKYGGTAELRCMMEKGDLVIHVIDHGPGMPEDEIESAFQPFRRLSTSTGTGTGIGLTIAQAQVATFGGVVNLRNAPEGGLVAEIRVATEKARR